MIWLKQLLWFATLPLYLELKVLEAIFALFGSELKFTSWWENFWGEYYKNKEKRDTFRENKAIKKLIKKMRRDE